MDIMKSKKVSFRNGSGGVLDGILDMPDSGLNYPAVIICHGFALTKEFKPLHMLSEALASKGYLTLRFDFSECIEDGRKVLGNKLLDCQASDIISALDFVLGLKVVEKGGIGVIGHSMGALSALLASARDARISTLVLVAMPSNAVQRPSGSEAGASDDYDSNSIIQRVNVPVRMIRGSEDKIVTLDETEKVFANANMPKDLTVIKGGDHLFLNKSHAEPMVKASVEWLCTYLK